MPVPPPPDSLNSITVKAADILNAAMREIGALATGEQPSIGDSADVLQKLQRLIDRFNAREPMVYNVNFTRFTLPVATQPVTIGPSGDFDANQRPVKIYSCGLILTGTDPEVEIPVNIRDQAWWANNRVKNLESTLPTDLYYSPDWALGQCFFWPIPTQANDVRLETRLVLTEVRDYNASFSMPPGYWDALVYSLAESIGPMFERPISADLLRLKAAAIKAIQVNNIASPRGHTGDAGMPGIGVRGNFDYYSGMSK